VCWAREKPQSEKVALLRCLRPLAATVSGPRPEKTRSLPGAGDSGGRRNNKHLHVMVKCSVERRGMYNLTVHHRVGEKIRIYAA